MARVMTAAEIAAAKPVLPAPGQSQMAFARETMERTGQWHPWQSMGRRWSIGCVALEITQRCNLDCTLCYLSDHSEAVKDLPLAEVFRRIDGIRAQYGIDTDVQITGGDPTLRKRDELVAIVRRVRESGMRPSLFTNGIKATREMLVELCDAGLVDVAFHVDMTQERKGYNSEAALNAIRAEYIARCRGLPLSVMFNTTVFDGNFHEVPAITAFFVQHAEAVRLVSFQLQADTGRGTAGGSRSPITIETVAAALQQGAGAPVALDTPVAGHAACNRYALTLVANGRVHDLFDDKGYLASLFTSLAGVQFDRQSRARALLTLTVALMRTPGVIVRGIPFAVRKLWAMKGDLLASRGRAHKLSFFIHDFMDAGCLDCERIEACVFMVATADGPISMCLQNAKRDEIITKPIEHGGAYWDPLTGKSTTSAEASAATLTRKTLKGRMRAAAEGTGP